MPLLLLPLVLLLFLGALLLLIPFSIRQRYRMGTARRLARGWVAGANAVGMGISVLLFLGSAALTSYWISGAFRYGALGLVAGGLLGLAGLKLTHWEGASEGLYYTPNRWMVLSVTLVVTARIGFGLWRATQSWQASAGHRSWVIEAGIPDSLAAGAVVLGYYLVFWTGVWLRIKGQGRLKARVIS